ncbi:MAG TPA: FHA domain-containing protein [Gemmataceae bacterium]|jgi:pSer/pThr/pTyr-binding forkhead associated (FHA) protein
MVPTVTLIVTRGPLAGRKFVFDDTTDCTIGRSRDCTIALPLEAEHLDVSRRHCLIRIAPPEACVRDLGSLNGTYVNGRKIGQRGDRQASTEAAGAESPAVPVTEGDEVQLGEHTAFRVCVFVPSTIEESPRKRRRSSGELRFPEPVPH